MKTLLLFTLLLPVFCSAQKVALIDKNFKKPIIFTDSVTVAQVSSNYFPIEVAKLDSFVSNLEYIKTSIKSGGKIQRSKLKSYRLKSGQTYIKTEAVPHAYGDSYDITVHTSLNNVTAQLLLADNTFKNKAVIKRVEKIQNYILSEKSLNVKKYAEYMPTALDQTIYIP